ncbi:MAG: cell division protein FtsZ [Chitinophagaceae bacterium]|nr:cell division protein FtsZ [Chitinophagaceae bacterium]
MIQFELPQNNNNSIIKVIGVGGGGGNAVNYMYGLGIEGVDFIVCNTDQKALNNSNVPTKIQLGPSLTQGLGAGANPEIGHRACLESIQEIENLLVQNTKMVFITAGMGGGTGTGGAPIVAKVAKELGILTVGIITTPFSYEGKRRQRQAEEGIEAMRQYVDTILVISNDKLRQLFGNIPTSQAFCKADDILATATKCITDVINSQGHIVVDFADVSTVMRDGGVAILGSAQAKGDNRAYEAVEQAIHSPLLNDSNIKGAKWVLLNINSSRGIYEHTLDEVEMIQAYVQDQAGEACDVIFGTGFDDNLDEHISVTVIATGFEYNKTENAYTQEHKKPYSDKNKVVMSLDESGTKNSFVEQNLPEEKQDEVIQPEAIIEPVQDPMMPTLKIIEEPSVPNTLAFGLGARFQKVQTEESREENLFNNSVREEQERIVFELNQEMLSVSKEIDQPVFNEPPVSKPEVTLDVQSELDHLFGHNTNQMSVQESQPELRDEWVTIKGITLNRRKGNRLQSDSELEAEANFELQKRAFDERASKLRSMSFNINKADIDDQDANIPAYQRKNVSLEQHEHSSDDTFTNLSVRDNNPQSPISTLNSFLNGKQPD